MAFSGMDVGQVQALAARVQAQAVLADAVVSTVDGAISVLSGSWFGEDLEAFARSWTQMHRVNATAVASQLHDLVTVLNNQAGAQEETSGGGGTPALSGGVFGMAGVVAGVGSVVAGAFGMTENAFDKAMDLAESPLPGSGVSAWTLAADANDVAGLAGHATDVAGPLERAAPGVTAVMDTAGALHTIDEVAHGDAHFYDVTDEVATLAGPVAAKAGPVGMLGDLAVHLFSYDAQAATNVDWSRQGMQEAFAYMASHPGDDLASVGDSVEQLGANMGDWVAGWF